MYDPKSSKAEEFISHEEVLETLEYAQKNKNNAELIDSIIEKAKLRKGLSHREASVLLECEMPDKNQEIFALAEQIKKDIYGNHCPVCAPVSVQLLRKWVRILSVPQKEQAHHPKENDSGGSPPGGYRPSGYGTQAPCH